MIESLTADLMPCHLNSRRCLRPSPRALLTLALSSGRTWRGAGSASDVTRPIRLLQRLVSRLVTIRIPRITPSLLNREERLSVVRSPLGRLGIVAR